MNFFIWRKNNLSFSRYQDFWVFMKPADFNICGIIISIAASCKLQLRLFLLNPKCCMANISNMFLTECWRLETSSRLFYDFIKKTIQQDLAIFNGWHIPFIIILYSSFQKNELLEPWHIWLLSNWGRLLN